MYRFNSSIFVVQSTIGNVNMNVPGEISMQKERTLQLVVSVTRA